jgi:hypothetical protein
MTIDRQVEPGSAGILGRRRCHLNDMHRQAQRICRDITAEARRVNGITPQDRSLFFHNRPRIR